MRGLKDAGVVGKQTKQQAHQQHFERVAAVAAGFEGVVQAAHAFGGLDVDRVFRANGLHLVAQQHAKVLDVFVQVFELEAQYLATLQGLQLKLPKVAHHHQVGQFVIGDVVQVVHRLRAGSGQVFAQGLLLHQQLARPKQVHKALGAAELFDVVLEGGYPFVGDAKDLKEVDPKRRALALFVACIRPRLAEKQCSGFNLVPVKTH